MSVEAPPSVTPTWYRWRVTLREDLHTGTGTGRGRELDAVQARDADGRPVVRDTHVKGLLLQAARELREFGAPVATDDAIARLFGRAGEAHRGAAVWTSLRWEGGGTTPFVTWGSTARVPGQRAPQEDTLRMVEHVAAGTTFTATILLYDATLFPLLEACVHRCDRLGAQRSRGVGLVHGTIAPQEAPSHDGPGQPTDDTLRLRLLLRAAEPLCLPMTGVPESQAPGESFLRATALRGALLAMARRWGPDEAMALADRAVSVGNGWPLPRDLEALSLDELATLDVLPMPLHLGTPKAGRGGAADELPWWLPDAPVTWLGEAGERDRLAADHDDEKLQRPKADEYLARIASTAWRRYRPRRGVHLRNTPPTDRRSDDARLFGEGEVAEGTAFVADLVFPSVAVAREALRGLTPWLEGADLLPVGRGGRPVACVRSCWLPHVPKLRPPCDEGGFSIVLESDLLARDAWLGFHERLSPEVLASLAGVDATGCVFDGGMNDVVEVRGFNAVSGLPREVAVALRRGSVVRVKGEGAPALHRALAAKPWLGERAWEGFGRFRLDPDFFGDATPRTSPATRTVTDVASLDEADALGRRLGASRSGPSRSQWQALRQQVLLAANEAALEAVFEDVSTHARETKGGASWATVPWGELVALGVEGGLSARREALDVCIRRVLVQRKGTR